MTAGEPSRDAVAEALEWFSDDFGWGNKPELNMNRKHGRALAAEVRRLEAELGRRGAAPDGLLRLVPVEPTAAMRAAFRADEEPHLFFFTTLAIGDFDQRYAAMLDASPAPDAAPTVPDGPLREARESLDDFLFFWRRSLLPMRAELALAKLDAALSALLDAPDSISPRSPQKP